MATSAAGIDEATFICPCCFSMQYVVSCWTCNSWHEHSPALHEGVYNIRLPLRHESVELRASLSYHLEAQESIFGSFNSALVNCSNYMILMIEIGVMEQNAFLL